MTRVLIDADPYCENGRPFSEQGQWPCGWISCPGAGLVPFVSAYRLRFTAAQPETVRVHVTADERYVLYLDGACIGRGSERGDAENWFFETYDLELDAGEHTLVARVWTLGDLAPYAQMSVRPGFLLSPQENNRQAQLGTGRAAWEAKGVEGYTFTNPLAAWGTGANLVLDGSRYPWGVETGTGNGWQPVIARSGSAGTDRMNDAAPMHRLRPAVLPPMRDVSWPLGAVRLAAPLETDSTAAVPVRAADHLPEEAAAWQRLLRGTGSVTLPPSTRRRVLIDLEDYVSAYPCLQTTGGAGSSVRIHWQEALFETPVYDPENKERKGNRGEIEGKYFRTIWSGEDGIGDMFLPDGGDARHFETLRWQAGRFVEIVVQTADASLTVNGLEFRETRYPLERGTDFTASDTRLERINALSLRTLQMCAHETYLDCQYEQLQYVGDTRIQALITYAITHDDRLARKALEMFGASRLLSGLTQSRYPSRVRQVTHPFSLHWIGMVRDFALWRGDRTFVRSLLLGVRAVLNGFAAFTEQREDSLAALPPGLNFNFVDWVPEWPHRTPPGGPDGVSAVVNWQWATALRQVSELEAWAGEPELSARAGRLARRHMERTHAAFWNGARGLYADNLAHQSFSEHAQCLAALSGLLGATSLRRLRHGLLSAPDLARTTVYFTHYLFEAYRILGCGDALFDRLPAWFAMADSGLCTTVEMPEPTRSDCHAWSAHPLFHASATILGIRPAGAGFASVDIAPALGPLLWASGTMPHPGGGEISVHLRREPDRLCADITLPAGIGGTLRFGGGTYPLSPGPQPVTLPIG